jgi:hypothetical protein
VSDDPTTAPKTWLIVSGIDNFRASKALGFTVQGMKSRHRRKAERMHDGDRIVYYITGIKAFAGIVRVTGDYFESHERIWVAKDPKKDTEDYPFRVPIVAETILDEPDFVPAEPIARQMVYVARYPPQNWTLAFQGNVHDLPAGDFALIEDAITSATAPVSAEDRTIDVGAH